MRFAFVTPEFPTALFGAGGLSNYAGRISRLLAGCGHSVEVFVCPYGAREQLQWHGVTVHHVQASSPLSVRIPFKVFSRLGRHQQAARIILTNASKVAVAALEAAHDCRPFDVVQSADFRGLSACLGPRRGRRHVVRCSAALGLYNEVDGVGGPELQAQIALEEGCIAAADVAYAPSKLVADHYSKKLGREILVVRPPAFLDAEPTPKPMWAPERYLIHFAGLLMRRKGTDLVAEAVRRAVSLEPALTMIWVGRAWPEQLKTWTAAMGPAARNVLMAHALPKPTLYALVAAARASVLPSLIDNLPNTVIESLLLGTPVIGTRGASIDELVENGLHGLLIDQGDVDGLADAMVRAWRGELDLNSTPWLETRKGRDFEPKTALANFVAMVI